MNNSINDNLVDDKELNEYLSGDTQYSQRYRAMQSDTVPPEIDALVLGNAATGNVVPIRAGAAKQSETPRRTKSLGFWMRVSVPVTLAASFVFGISILFENGVRPTATPATQAIADTAMPSLEVAEREASSSVAPEPVVVELRKPIDKREDGAPVASVAAPKTTAVPAEEARQMPQAPPTAQDATAPIPPGANTTPTAASPAAKLEETNVTGQLIKSNAESVALPIEVVSAEDMSRARSGTSENAAAATAATMKPIASDADRPDTAARGSTALELETVIVTAQKRQSTGGGAGPRNSIPPSNLEAREPSDAEIAKERREANPGAWLVFIRELRTSGKSREADREWQRFVKAYPAYAVDAADSARPKK